jgi:hypothetical protein
MTSLYVLIMSGKVDVVEAALTTNLETLANDPAEASAHQAERACMVVPLLQLTEQQQEIIAVGTGLHHDLLAALHRERQDINRQMTAVVEAAGADSSAAHSQTGSSTTGSGSSGSMVLTPNLPDRRVQLQRQQDLANRLNTLLHKEVRNPAAAHAAAHMGWCGCMMAAVLQTCIVCSKFNAASFE